MWICFNDGFISAVQDRGSPKRLVVRARRREILESLFPDKEIVVSVFSDYKYRVFSSKDEFADLVVARTAGIQYDNFKDSVADEDLRRLYSDFWLMHLDYQN